jgi:hypothetical protein
VTLSALALLLCACGGSTSSTGKSSGGGGGGSSSASGGGGGNGGQQHPVVGTINTVFTRIATIDSEPAASGQEFRAQQILSSDAGGSFSLSLDKFDDCRVFPNSSVQAKPSSAILLTWLSGTAWCRTDPEASSSIDLKAGVATITMSDPVFGITVADELVTIRVSSGSVEVSLEATGASLVVASGEQVTLSPDQGISSPGGLDVGSLPPDEQTAVGDLMAQVPAPDFGRPDASTSVTLTRMFESGSMNVAIDEAGLEGSGAAGGDGGLIGFVQDYLDFLAVSWDLQLNLTVASAGEAAAEVREGKIDVFVAPTLPPDLPSTPFFVDTGERAQTWHLVVGPDDPTLRDALARFVTTSVGSGDYGERFLRSFGVLPSYEPLREQLGY